jgi:arylsulfatase A-like enzyme
MNQQRPNIILVVTDDQGYGDLSCTGNPIIQTPNIDAFYDESVRLTNFHVGPTCAPTRSTILTGHYANSTGVWHTIGGRSLLRADEVTLADALQDAGYRTGIFGKWHLGDNYPYRPQDRGFDDVIVHGGGGISQTPDYWGNDYFDDTYFVNGTPQKFDGYCTDVWFREGMNFIEANQSEPFFCYIAPNAPHSPFNVEPRYSQPYKDQLSEDRANFFGMITNIDENFGKLRQKLQDLDLQDNTILIFMTDNGTAAGINVDDEHFVTDGYNAGMRGQKGSQYDGGHRVPFFIYWKDGHIQGGWDIKQLTASVDMMPTLLDLCSANGDSSLEFHGTSIKPLLVNDSSDWQERVLVTDSQRLTNPVKWRKSAVMTDSWRLIDGRELYNIDTDREQRSNIAEQYPDIVAQLRDEYENWWEIVSVQFDHDIPIAIGTDDEAETHLTCHDWRNEKSDSPWNQQLIRQGYIANGYWELDVKQAGQYRVELRRWPHTTSHSLIAGIDGDDIEWREDWISKKYKSFYSGGAALNITQAALTLTDPTTYTTTTHQSDINPNDAMVSFDVKLNAGLLHLQTLLDGDDTQLGAYFVTLRRHGS